MASSTEIAAGNEQQTVVAPVKLIPTSKKKSTFMLHDPDTMTCKGKFVAMDFRYAALKCASRGNTTIYLRKTNTREIRVFEGAIVELEQPKEIRRGDRVITYRTKPVVKFLRKFVFENAPVDEPEHGEETAAAKDTSAATQ